MKFLAAILMSLVAGVSIAKAGDGYGNCYVENGTAHVMFCSDSSDSGSGTGYVTTYDRTGSRLDRNMVIYVGIAIMGCDEVDTFNAGSNAVSCSFQLAQ